MSLKQVIVVRDDLGMSQGKVAAQTAHASLYAADRASSDVRQEWLNAGPEKVVLAASSTEKLRTLQSSATAAGLPTSLVRDAGRTEVDAGSTTALAIGPAPSDTVDDITGGLALF